MIPKINSAHGSDTRNIINRAIEVLNHLGIDVQTLVAEGQLTEEQYAELLTTINGLVKSGHVDKGDLTPEFKGEIEGFNAQLAHEARKVESLKTSKMDKNTTDISVSQINKNKGKLDETFMTDKLRQQMTGDTPLHSTPADYSLTSNKYADQSVYPHALSFAKKPNNLLTLKNVARGYSISSSTGGLNENPNISVSDFIMIKPNTVYTVENSGRAAFYDEAKNFVGTTTSETFTTPEGAYFSRHSFATGNIDFVQLNEGDLKDYDVSESVIGDDDNVVVSPSAKSIKKGSFLKDAVSPHDISFTVSSKNIFNKNTVLDGYSLNRDNGKPEANENNFLSDFISIEPSTSYSKNSVSASAAYYNRNKSFIIATSMSASTETFTTPKNAEYIRITSNLRNVDNFMLNAGDNSLPFEEYKHKIMSTSDEPLEIDVNLLPDYPEMPTTKTNVWFSAEPIPRFYNASDEPSYDEGGFSYVNSETPYDEYMSKWRELATNNPNYITETHLGKDCTGTYDMYRYSLRNDNYDIRGSGANIKEFPKVLIVASLHGEEKWAAFALYYLFKDMIENWQTDKGLEYLRFNVNFEIIPIGNPSGWMAGYAGSRTNANGVDLNRNFDSNWTESSVSGSEPFSEIEAQYVRDMILNNLDASYFLDYHTNGTSGTNWTNMYWTAIGGDNKGIANVVRSSKTTFSKCSRKWIHEKGLQSEEDIIGFVSINTGTPGTTTGYARKEGVLGVTIEDVKEFPSGENRKSSFVATANKEYFGNILLHHLQGFKENPLK